ncbi:unnamed protein product [Rhodiola kirilowii]
MEDDENEQQQPTTPFWIQKTTFRSSTHIFASFSSIFFNSTSIIILLVVAAVLIFIIIIIPSVLNFTSQIFRPNSVKRSWDSLNLVLILFAIICAFLGRTNNNNENLNSASGRFRSPSPSPSYSNKEQRSSEYSDRSYSSSRMRSRSSYPDLTIYENSPWDYIDRSSNHAYRFSDDTQIKSYQFSDSGWQISPRRTQPPPQDRVTEAEDDKVVGNPKAVEALPPPLTSPPSTPPPPLLSQPLPPFNPLLLRVKPRSRRTYLATERAEAVYETGNGNQKTNSPPSPLRGTVKRKTKRVHRSFDDEEQQQKPPSPTRHTLQSDLSKKSDKKKDFLSSFNINPKRKKKRERQLSLDNLDHILNPPIQIPASTTMPPPPSVFHNIFSSKKVKTKKSASDPPSITSKGKFTKPNTKIALAQSLIQTPIITRGNESPLYGIPEPPPLPPFGMLVWKFVVEGDYVRLKSMNSSRSVSPDRDDSIRASSSMRSDVDEEASPPQSPAMFFPSPDVNTKADNFIATFRAGLKMEKVNSGKGVGLSRLGPTSNSEQK